MSHGGVGNEEGPLPAEDTSNLLSALKDVETDTAAVAQSFGEMVSSTAVALQKIENLSIEYMESMQRSSQQLHNSVEMATNHTRVFISKCDQLERQLSRMDRLESQVERSSMLLTRIEAIVEKKVAAVVKQKQSMLATT